MSWAAIEGFRKWTAKRRRLLHGVDRLADTSAAVPEVKPAGQSFPAEQLNQLNGWLLSLSTSYAGPLFSFTNGTVY